MNYVGIKTKPGAGTPGFAHSTWRLYADRSYPIGYAGATNSLPVLPIALDSAGYGETLFWGALP